MKVSHFHLGVHNQGQMGPLHEDLQHGQTDTFEDPYLWMTDIFQAHESTFTHSWHAISINGNNSLLASNLD